MSVALGELYAALLEAGVPPEKAERAAEEVLEATRARRLSILPALGDGATTSRAAWGKGAVWFSLFQLLCVIAVFVFILVLGTYHLASIDGYLKEQTRAIAELRGMMSDLRDRLVPP